jgi:hypothetical protein
MFFPPSVSQRFFAAFDFFAAWCSLGACSEIVGSAAI